MTPEPYWTSPDGRHSIFCGDCLAIMPTLAGPFDAIIADLPFGSTACAWDTRIPFEPLWEQYRRLVKCNGAVVLFGSQPFTSALVMSNAKWFRYEWVWQKPSGHHTGFANAAFQPMKAHENVLVFSQMRTRSSQFVSERMTYNPQGVRDATKIHGGRSKRKSSCWTARGDIENAYMPSGSGYPLSVIEFGRDSRGLHPTQKPVALLEYLVRTYTNEGEIVLDNTAGSMTLGVACIRTGRRSVQIEMSEEYCRIGIRRMEQALDAYQPALPLDVPARANEQADLFAEVPT